MSLEVSIGKVTVADGLPNVWNSGKRENTFEDQLKPSFNAI